MLIPFNHLFRKHGIKLNQVLHVGANTGQEAIEYQRHGAKEVWWVEAHGPTFQKLIQHISPFKGHNALLACISNVDGEQVSFHVANNGAQSSSILEFGTHTKEHPTVRFVSNVPMKTKRLDRLIAECGIEFEQDAFLNIDLQGAEMLALDGLGKELDHFKHLYLEVNESELYKGCPLVDDLDQWLIHRGFVPKDVHMTGSGWGDKYYQRH
jgi:FkbM family methyltransferase